MSIQSSAATGAVAREIATLVTAEMKQINKPSYTKDEVNAILFRLLRACKIIKEGADAGYD